MKYFSLTVLLISLLFALKAYPAEHIFSCGSMKDVMSKNMKDGYAYFAVGKENNGIVIALFINMNNGDFRIMGVDNSLKACNMIAGQEWEFFKIVHM